METHAFDHKTFSNIFSKARSDSSDLALIYSIKLDSLN